VTKRGVAGGGKKVSTFHLLLRLGRSGRLREGTFFVQPTVREDAHNLTLRHLAERVGACRGQNEIEETRKEGEGAQGRTVKNERKRESADISQAGGKRLFMS